jgi:branched-subunit amino acid ABC-type transport system permease component
MMSVARFINIGAGAIMAIGAYTTHLLTSISQLGFLATAGLVFLTSSVIGLVFYLGVNKMGLFDQPEHTIEDLSVILSYGFYLFITGGLSLLFGARYTSVNVKLELHLSLSFIKETELIILIIALLVASVMHLVFISNNNLGLKSKAVIQNIQASIAIGINTKRIFAIVFMLSFGVLGLSGCLYVLLYPINPYFGLYYTVLGFVAAGVSGVGNLLYSFVIASVISILYSFLGLVIPLGVAIAISYFLMLLILVAKPEGLKRGLR